jgi:hypothetical protein
MSGDMHETLRKLTDVGVFVNLSPTPMRGGIEYTLSVSIDGLDLEGLKRVIAIVEKDDYDAKLRGSWIELHHRPD